METEATGYRSTETWKSSTVRWFVSHLGAGRDKLAAKVGATFDRAHAWPEANMAGSTVVKRKRRQTWMEQSEFWPEVSGDTKTDMPAEAASTRRASREESAKTADESLDFVKIAPLRSPEVVVARVERMARVSGGVKKAETHRHITARPVLPKHNSIARFLNVNGAIEGMKTDAIRFDLPGRGLPQALRLWSGSSNMDSYNVVRF